MRLIVPNFQTDSQLVWIEPVADVIARHGVLDEEGNFISRPFTLPELVVKLNEVLQLKTSITTEFNRPSGDVHSVFQIAIGS